MKIKTAITSAFAGVLFATANAQASETRLVGATDSPAASVCIAAVESDKAARQAALRLGVFEFNLASLVCNGKPVEDFVAQYRDTSAPQQAGDMTSTEIVSFSARDESPVTQLCVAAVTSPDRFNEIRQQHFRLMSEAELLESVRCNSKPLERFVSEFRNQELTASL